MVAAVTMTTTTGAKQEIPESSRWPMAEDKARLEGSFLSGFLLSELAALSDMTAIKSYTDFLRRFFTHISKGPTYSLVHG